MSKNLTRNLLMLLTVVFAVSTTTACDTVKSTSTDPSTSVSQKNADKGTALAALNGLAVKGRAPKTGYSRDQFGVEWDDSVGNFSWSRNGCDTRDDVLARDLQRETIDSDGCTVLNGVLAYEPYTGDKNRSFVRAGSYDQSFDIEHVESLGDAWVTGAQQLSAKDRAMLANDPINLFVADPSQNRAKGDADAASWLPPNKSFRCSYVARQIRVKVKYHLWVIPAEKDAMVRVLDGCPNEPLAQSDVETGYTVSESTQTTSTPSPETTPSVKPSISSATPTNTSNGSVSYANCDAVRAAGAAPIHKGDPGYSTNLDRDGDGTGCE